MSKKPLSEMSLEELWQLFPIFLTKHNENWNKLYDDECNFLKTALMNISGYKIHHIGSTAINNIMAKPIVDILLEVPTKYDLRDIKNIILNIGYLCMSEDKNRISFNKGYTPDGFAEKVFHLHLRYTGDNDELYFRDYLNDNPTVAKEYEALKLCLWKKYEHNRDAYTGAKSEFILKYTNKAKELYKGRYENKQ